MEELIWGDHSQHKWTKPGALFTRGPGTYKIPSFNDVPLDMRVELLSDAPNPRAIYSSKAIGEPPLFLGASAFFATTPANKYTIIILSNSSNSAPIFLYQKIRGLLGFPTGLINY